MLVPAGTALVSGPAASEPEELRGTRTDLEVTRQGGCRRSMVALNLKPNQPWDGGPPFCSDSGRICEYRHARPRHNRGHHDRLD
jgi:hypothetical protein